MGEVLAKACVAQNIDRDGEAMNIKRSEWSPAAPIGDAATNGARFSRARPRISLVVAWQGCSNELSRRLQLWDRWVESGIDVVVVCSCPAADRQRIAATHPAVRLVEASVGDDIAELRQSGVSAARGDIVVIVDDTMGRNTSWRDPLPMAIGSDMLSAPECHALQVAT